MIRKITVTQSKVHKILQSFSIVKVLIDSALIEYQQFLDHNFKSPTIHQKLKQASENLESTSNHIGSKFLITKDEYAKDEMTGDIHEVVGLVLKLDEPTLAELLGNLKKAVNGELGELSEVLELAASIDDSKKERVIKYLTRINKEKAA